MITHRFRSGILLAGILTLTLVLAACGSQKPAQPAAARNPPRNPPSNPPRKRSRSASSII